MFEKTEPWNTQCRVDTPGGIGTLYRRICGLIVSAVALPWRIHGWVVPAETETYLITDQSGYLKLLVYERKYRRNAERFEDRYEDVIRIEPFHRIPQSDASN